MLSAKQALHLGYQAGIVTATVALERTLHSLPTASGREETVKAHWILMSLIEKDAKDVERAIKEIDRLLGPGVASPVARPWKDFPETRKRITEAASPLVEAGSFESVTLELALVSADLYVAGKTADATGMVYDLMVGTSNRDEGIRNRFRTALAGIESARASLLKVEKLFQQALIGQPLSPAVAAAAAKLRQLAVNDPPTFDGARSRQLYRPGEKWCRELAGARWNLDQAIGFPEEPVPVAPSKLEAGALASILAHPDDGEARLKWAALAATRKEPRADLVLDLMRVRNERRSPPHYQSFPSVLTRSLLERHPEWSDPVKRLGATEVAFRRGFVEWIRIDAATFVENSSALFREAPILYLRLVNVAPALEALVASGLLSRFLSLDVSDEGLSDTQILRLVEGSDLRNLRGLDLRKNGLTVEGLRRLYTSPAIPRLVYCPLDENPCGPLYQTDWTPEEYPREIWVSSTLGSQLESQLGKRVWGMPWAQEWPPDFDVLTVDLQWAGAPPP